ncbi:MAG: NADH:ubiquinone oxidoreductase subunit J [Gammaproteobacteria bacterium RIFCSPHIGHO2_12_FULL_38_11]|nr:MAG: NADH:ubiquinone oxidoreductase subunit J [Gammaproteobacteria bacterium RIFCSPHIGHO2_12_FULL_38_11]
MLFPIHQVIFYVFTILLVASATMVITAKSPVKAVLFLVVAFFASAVLWMSMQAEFLSLLLIFVYVGAVMTLFLFVVMMLKTENKQTPSSPLSLLSLGFLCLIMLVGTAFYVFALHWPLANTLPTHYDASYNNVEAIGTLLFTNYLFPFEICAVLLLVGMISAIALAFHGKKSDTKSQSINKQTQANKKDRLRIINLK